MKWLIALVLTATVAQAEPAWKHFENARFGFSIDVPSGLIEQPPPENGDGATFLAADQSAELRVWGNYPIDENFRQDARSRLASEKTEGWRITYAAIKSGWHVYSGTKSDRIVYAKGVSSCAGKVALNFRLEYPKAEKLQYDAMVTRLSKSLKSSAGSDCP